MGGWVIALNSPPTPHPLKVRGRSVFEIFSNLTYKGGNLTFNLPEYACSLLSIRVLRNFAARKGDHSIYRAVLMFTFSW